MRKNAVLMMALALSACSSWDLSELHRITDYSEAVIDSSDRRYWTEDSFIHDTVIRFVAVEAEAGYDWRKDTLGGSFNGKLILFRNYMPELTLDFGPEYEISPDYATHYIIDSQLFTYYCTESVSVVKCNGREIMRAAGREELKGLLPTDEGILTLSKRASNDNFFVRLNGREVMRFQADGIFGSMTDDSYPSSGALYMDRGNTYFCYYTNVAGDTAYYIVENLKTRALQPPANLAEYEIRDIKIDRGDISYFMIHNRLQPCIYKSGTMECFKCDSDVERYYDGRILADRGLSIALGYYYARNGLFGRTLLFPPGHRENYSHYNDGFTIPGNGKAYSLIKFIDNDYFVIRHDSSSGRRAGQDCFCFSQRCCSSLDGFTGVAFTPKRRELKPYVWIDGDTVQVNIKNGYLTALSLKDSITTIPGGFHPELVQ